MKYKCYALVDPYTLEAILLLFSKLLSVLDFQDACIFAKFSYEYSKKNHNELDE
jgi:hypothetical protein